MSLFYIAACPACGGRFRLDYDFGPGWLNPQTVLELSCPNCWSRFRTEGSALAGYGAGGEAFPLGRLLHRVILRYDCPGCRMHGIHVLGLLTDWPREELEAYKQSNLQCSNPGCSLSGKSQELRPAQVEFEQLGEQGPRLRERV